MDKATYARIETYMLDCMKDSAHDREHVVRVLYFALDIAKTESGVNTDALIAACLLHDIGREEQYRNPKLRHERIGSEKAYHFLRGIGWPEAEAGRVRDCIASHSYRGGTPPASIEAKIVFDADKLDAVGTLGIARTLQYQGAVGEPLYSVDAQGSVSGGANDARPSFFREYKFKLETLYDRFYTDRAREIASGRRRSAEVFYNGMLWEVRACYENGRRALCDAIGEA